MTDGDVSGASGDVGARASAPEDRPWLARDGWASSSRLRRADPVRRDQARSFAEDGVVILRAAVPRSLCDAVVASLAPHFERRGPARITNAAWALEPVRQLATLPAVVEVIEFLYGRRAIPFQTLDFCEGTQQELHRDDVHFDSLPAGFMCAAWVALEDIGPDQGPVSYRPGSHREGGDLSGPASEPATFTARAGDVLIWSAPVLHGGAPVESAGSSRWSQVTHYFFEGCVWYTPMHSDLGIGALALRDPLIDVATLRTAVPERDGRRARFLRLRGGQANVVAAGEPSSRWQRRAWRGGADRLSRRIQARWARAVRRPPAR